jgi:holliday junction DNA helicase RuvA
MITHLRGTLTQKAPTAAVIDIGGVGYGVAISLISYEQLPEVGADAQIFTYLYVREDRMELFGFAQERERELFELLIGVSGIGPTSAQTILSGMSQRDLQEAIFHGRVNELTAIKGIGKRTAERMVLELKEKVGFPTPEEEAAAEEGKKTSPGIVEEAVLAMMALGIAPGAARQAVSKADRRLGGAQSVQQLLKQALKER